MRRRRPDPAFTQLLKDFLKAEVFAKESVEAQVLSRVADDGPQSLDGKDHAIWLERVLPIVSKPLREQALVADIVRNGGRIPMRIEPTRRQSFKRPTTIPMRLRLK